MKDRCKRCGRYYPGYYLVNGICYDCRLYVLEFGGLVRSRGIGSKILEMVLSGDISFLERPEEVLGVSREEALERCSEVLEFLRGYRISGVRRVVGWFDDISQRSKLFDVEDYRSSKELRDREEGVDSGKKEFRRLRYRNLQKYRREKICSRDFVYVSEADKRAIIFDWLNRKG